MFQTDESAIKYIRKLIVDGAVDVTTLEDFLSYYSQFIPPATANDFGSTDIQRAANFYRQYTKGTVVLADDLIFQGGLYLQKEPILGLEITGFFAIYGDDFVSCIVEVGKDEIITVDTLDIVEALKAGKIECVTLKKSRLLQANVTPEKDGDIVEATSYLTKLYASRDIKGVHVLDDVEELYDKVYKDIPATTEEKVLAIARLYKRNGEYYNIKSPEVLEDDPGTVHTGDVYTFKKTTSFGSKNDAFVVMNVPQSDKIICSVFEPQWKYKKDILAITIAAIGTTALVFTPPIVAGVLAGGAAVGTGTSVAGAAMAGAASTGSLMTAEAGVTIAGLTAESATAVAGSAFAMGNTALAAEYAAMVSTARNAGYICKIAAHIGSVGKSALIADATAAVGLTAKKNQYEHKGQFCIKQCDFVRMIADKKIALVARKTYANLIKVEETKNEQREILSKGNKSSTSK